ncbi:MAG TPA: hypothetical protein VF455_10720 [Chryseobacterium sp.]
MAKILGLDIGINSIGWAVFDNSSSQIIGKGVKIFYITNNERQLTRIHSRTCNRGIHRLFNFYKKNKLSIQISPIIITLIFCSVLTALLAVINIRNWQFWLNLSLTVFVATLSLLYQHKK